MMNYGLGQQLMGAGGMQADGLPPQLAGALGGGNMGGGMDQMSWLAKMLGGGIKMPMFANGLPGRALGSQGIPMGVLGLLGRQLGK